MFYFFNSYTYLDIIFAVKREVGEIYFEERCKFLVKDLYRRLSLEKEYTEDINSEYTTYNSDILI